MTFLPYNNRFTAFYPRLYGWAGTRDNILTPVMIINHSLSAFSIYYDPRHLPCSIYVLDSLFAQPFSKSALVKQPATTAMLSWLLNVCRVNFFYPPVSLPTHLLYLSVSQRSRYRHEISRLSTVVSPKIFMNTIFSWHSVVMYSGWVSSTPFWFNMYSIIW